MLVAVLVGDCTSLLGVGTLFVFSVSVPVPAGIDSVTCNRPVPRNASRSATLMPFPFDGEKISGVAGFSNIVCGVGTVFTGGWFVELTSVIVNCVLPLAWLSVNRLPAISVTPVAAVLSMSMT